MSCAAPFNTRPRSSAVERFQSRKPRSAACSARSRSTVSASGSSPSVEPLAGLMTRWVRRLPAASHSPSMWSLSSEYAVMSAYRLGKLVRGRPVAMQPAPQPGAELRGGDRACLQALGVENEEIGQAFDQAIDNRHQVAFALALAAGFGNEAGLLDGGRGTRPPGLRRAGLVIQARERVDHHPRGRATSR